MLNESPKASDPNSSTAQHVVRRLSGRYLFVLGAVAALIVVDQSLVQPLLVRVSAFAPAINVAGRQRMLSQRITKAALAAKDEADPSSRAAHLNELRQSLQQWTTEHDALDQGDPSLGIAAIHNRAVDEKWNVLLPHYDAMVAAAREIIQSGANNDRSPAARAATGALLEHEGRFLATMDQLVQLMEDEAATAVWRLRRSRPRLQP